MPETIIPLELFESFIKNSRYQPYKGYVRNLLLGDNNYSLKIQGDYVNTEFLMHNIRTSVMSYSKSKDNAIKCFQDFIAFLEENGITVPNPEKIQYPPIPVSNTFERLMFIAKYLQVEENKISDLPELLWVGETSIKNDIERLTKLDAEDPIQINGKRLLIPNYQEIDDHPTMDSTVHPIFLTENLAQIIVNLLGLKHMARKSQYRNFAEQTAKDIWGQLSEYAKDRIKTVYDELDNEQLQWFLSLEEADEKSFHSEQQCVQQNTEGAATIFHCMKTERRFCMEYDNGKEIVYYKDCKILNGAQHYETEIDVETDKGVQHILLENVRRSALTIEELC